ncbi:MAG: dTDP-glucose 4,6-dehydratase [Acidobacteria bacterium]|nr:MAG: dTDP-glucose 4,6-dehydratase [Acidobacteriota bacterium]
MRKAFVTGGAGFIGSAFVRLLLDESPSCEVTNFDALTYAGNLDNLDGLDSSRHYFIKGDICDHDAVFAALAENTDAIINFAAESHVDRSIASADEFLRTNILGTQVLLDVARARGVKRFLQVSTDEVMGSLPDDERAFFTQDSPFRPNSPYAASKAAAEHLVLANALNDEPIPVYGDGLNVRDWIYVDDHCRAILLALEKGRSGATYNIGARNERRNLEIAKSILDQLGKSHSLIKFVKDRPGHDRRYAIDPTLVETELGWRPRETWETGLRKMIEWYRSNIDWLERVRSGAYREYYERQYGAEAGVP